MTNFTTGQQVQLTRIYAKAIMGRRPNALNWLDRKGVVDHVTGIYVYVRWDGRNSLEQLPVKAVERAA